ncbi:MAG: 5-methyltetrahydropteroyltriglutamate--homocysteine S-methyltransferase [Phycisphaerales bacterium]
MSVRIANLGFPRIGAHRQLKKALELYWAGGLTAMELRDATRAIRRLNWELQRDLGVDFIPSNDFSLYDHVLDTAAMLGAVPSRFRYAGGPMDLETYFAMARGAETVKAMEMTKWFDTNYHYIVPELEAEQKFCLGSTKVVDEFVEAKQLGILTRPVLLGPVSFLLLSKARTPELKPLSLLDQIVPIYVSILGRLVASGAAWVQIDEPVLALDLDETTAGAFVRAYESLAPTTGRLSICLATYFGSLRENLDLALHLPVACVHLDLVRGPEQLKDALAKVPGDKSLSLGVINGRNVWRSRLLEVLPSLEEALRVLGPERTILAPSCSLLHCPVGLSAEPDLSSEVRERLAFAMQKLEELSVLRTALNRGRDAVRIAVEENENLFERIAGSRSVHDPQVQARMDRLSPALFARQNPFGQRLAQQRERLDLPVLPTTTIGSFPQTPAIRRTRAALRQGHITWKQYEAEMCRQIKQAIHIQEQIGLDVLVHGEPERNDMVEYFGEMLEGFVFTRNGWVQSYGSRCVKPPIIYGDVSRPKSMTVRWTCYAQSFTARPVKGMLTGPITMLQWSFVREDRPRRDVAFQIALAIRDEMADLEAAGIKIIQIDEPALREGLPLRKGDWPEYLDWAVGAFRLATSGVEDATQVHTHMCYGDFNDIIEAIAALDADVISIEAARSGVELLNAFSQFKYPNHIGPGVYDIHSPRVPSVEEMVEAITKQTTVLDAGQLWVNPDCGLKTRQWAEVRPALTNMVAAARQLRSQLADDKTLPRRAIDSGRRNVNQADERTGE